MTSSSHIAPVHLNEDPYVTIGQNLDDYMHATFKSRSKHPESELMTVKTITLDILIAVGYPVTLSAVFLNALRWILALSVALVFMFEICNEGHHTNYPTIVPLHDPVTTNSVSVVHALQQQLHEYFGRSSTNTGTQTCTRRE